MRSVDAPVPKASLWMNEANYEVYPPTEGRCRRQSIEWRRKSPRGTLNKSEFHLSYFSVFGVVRGFNPPMSSSESSRMARLAVRETSEGGGKSMRTVGTDEPQHDHNIFCSFFRCHDESSIANASGKRY